MPRRRPASSVLLAIVLGLALLLWLAFGDLSSFRDDPPPTAESETPPPPRVEIETRLAEPYAPTLTVQGHLEAYRSWSCALADPVAWKPPGFAGSARRAWRRTAASRARRPARAPGTGRSGAGPGPCRVIGRSRVTRSRAHLYPRFPSPPERGECRRRRTGRSAPTTGGYPDRGAVLRRAGQDRCRPGRTAPGG